jgi:phosphodiesterase/alkaline phosphatase D-like protein
LGSTIYRFQYGLTTAYGTQTYPGESIGSDETDHLASTEILRLIPGASYHFRAIATNFTGTTVGPDRTFTTPGAPAITATSAAAIGQTSVVLSAQINPDLSPTTYHFEFGASTAYGSRTPESVSIGADSSLHTASEEITGLTPGATYHFRVVATNGVGTANGPDQIFSTEKSEEKKPATAACKRGFFKKHGKCVKRHRRRKRSHRHA